MLILLIFLKLLQAEPGGDHDHNNGHTNFIGGKRPQPKRPTISSKTNYVTLNNNVVYGCNETYISVFIPKTAVSDENGEPVQNDRIMYRNDASFHCRSKEYNETHYAMFINVARWEYTCATTRFKDDFKIRYLNEVVWVNPVSMSMDSLANITCTIHTDGDIVVLNESATKSRIPTLWGAFGVNTNFYRTSEFNEHEVLSAVTQAPKVQVGYYVYVKSEIVEYPEGKSAQNNSEIVVVLDHCFASKSSDPDIYDEAFTYEIIEDRCIADPTVVIRKNGQGSTSQFKFQMFKWRNTINQYLYVHCKVVICNNAESDNKCSGQSLNYMCHGDPTKFRKKRSIENHGSVLDYRYSATQSFGPIIPWDSSVM